MLKHVSRRCDQHAVGLSAVLRAALSVTGAAAIEAEERSSSAQLGILNAKETIAIDKYDKNKHVSC